MIKMERNIVPHIAKFHSVAIPPLKGGEEAMRLGRGMFKTNHQS
ncbi:hypothetical protein SAMN05421640_2897 [Ekhidna lutea]|uniref:Uncharacterized protein n=1 Tax=Ekhidna lutea TaxID=447679 RepID=A0A239L2I4_EKHLU|nr:hypothetical protein SAMN05421640_2897 [Ekhidna lutea]